ncbi:BREX-1 system phosphatase PglZ type B [Methanoplanus endosymbiosus]|uniref:BREX-1 system phosphatase PglZ type B n=1 Tax=Methanoplanus endosymbiosus TaxID=33865 RepID=A0A9E7TLL6_9EURY|nr:BREX-1 system phosphatase PglZ type B [Methanoplanus endosymbiosus]UUX92491.1 BREX-1 system phosphatase PglZ type B [Methanoplanus endosymbiosus]
MPGKFIEEVKKAILSAASDYDRERLSAPVALIWTDHNREWEPVVEKLVKDHGMPIATFGSYDPEEFKGPAIYIRCLISHNLNGGSFGAADVSPDSGVSDESGIPGFPKEGTPVIYLPGYSKDVLRNPENCPEELMQLFELQYRGIVWSQKNNRDWTIPAFIKNILDIEIIMDKETRQAAINAVGALCDEDVTLIKNKAPLNASYFNSLIHPDTIKQLLLWMNSPKEEKERMGPEQWRPFCSICKSEYEFDPEKDTPVTAAEKLGSLKNNWHNVWSRFSENPDAYPAIPNLLRNAQRPQLCFYDDTWPQINDNHEKKVKTELLRLPELNRIEGIKLIRTLEHNHKIRREWIWTKTGDSPYACTLKYLAKLAETVSDNRFSGTIREQAERYTNEYFTADDAILKAIREAGKDKECLRITSAAIAAISKSWFNSLAESFQNEWITNPPEISKSGYKPEKGTVYLFVDGLRFDLANELKEIISKDHPETDLDFSYAALPTLTSTAKPAVMPIAGELVAGREFTPLTKTEAEANITALRRIMEENGIQVLSDSQTGDTEGSAWTDCGNIDHEGHDKQIELPQIIPAELERISKRVKELINAGWSEIKIVTDHGWVFMPGEMDKTELLPALTEVKKSRCARLRPDAKTNLPTAKWHWDRNATVVFAPGITCFDSGKVYEHGGLSPQEVIIPEITVKGREKAKTGLVKITELTWRGLRLKGKTEGCEGLSADIRTQPGDENSSLIDSVREISDEKISLLVLDDSLEGSEAFLVLMDSDNTVCYQKKITIGEE